MKWTKVTIETTTEATDMLSYLLGEYGVEGIEVEDRIPLSEEDKKAMFIDILPELPPDDGVAYISCYIDDSMDVKELCQYIEEQLADISAFMDTGSGRISIGETEDRDWINNWKEFFHPFRLEENIVIQPTWTEIADVGENDIVIHIDPGTAFGTGSHETTRLCISNLKKYIRTDGKTDVLDAGCGSGILSIVAMKLGAHRTYGIDIDELAVEASKENLKLNGISEEAYMVVQGDVIGDRQFAMKVAANGQFDIIVANILADVIIPLSAVVRPLMKQGGVFITSGIIDSKEEAVKKALEKNGFRIVEITHMGEWVCIIAE
ncbi:MAG: 50S ribosomal protein L11 methyltransferase [Lachnospiraceae bacterium]|nr:50S ribosomal protein L11 methyltransferase [Lachnospiraceae bacterium]MDE6625715.1 50S ribosomal protein L11 methyltransferase [Lachnospiraceae bacterium]